MYPRVRVELIVALVRHPLPGNVRDLYDFILKALAQSREDWIELPRELADAAKEPRSSGSKAPPSSEASSAPAQSGRRTKCTPEAVAAALEQAEGSVQRAALILGVPRRTLRNWMEEYGLRAKGDTG